MPYYITNDKSLTDCPAWAVIKKSPDGAVEKVACHPDKKSAIAHMVAVSNAEGMKPMGSYFPGGDSQRDNNNRIVVSDIDDTLVHNGNLIADVADFVTGLEVGIVLVTGRLESQRAETVALLDKVGMDYDQLIMNNLGSKALSTEFKTKTVKALQQNYDIIYAVDNNGGVRQAYADLGIDAIDPHNLPQTRSDRITKESQEDKMTIQKRDMVEPAGVEMAEPTKETLALSLRDLLGEVVAFKFLAHGFHWNVRGINFAQFHEFFEEIYTDADGSIDPIAESIRKLNFDSPFKLSDFTSSLQESEPTDSTDPLEMCRSLYVANEAVREDLAMAIELACEINETGIENFLQDRMGMHSKWQWQLRAIVGDSFARNYEIDLDEITEATGQDTETEPIPEGMDAGEPNPAGAIATDAPNFGFANTERSKWDAAAKLIVRKLEPTQEVETEGRAKGFETRINSQSVELRAVEDGNGMTFEGYAARFNSPSEPIGGKFVEYIAPGAFTRSIKTRGYDVKLLWNHDTSQVLGSTRSGTLTLVEDANGLLARATLPDTQAGRDAATLIKRGDVAGMSFGFQVPAGGDSWNAEGNVRTLNNIKLHEVSITPFPAYPATTASVRTEIRAIDADVLAGGLAQLEAGEALDEAQAKAIREVVDKLTEKPAADSLDIFKMKLNLQGKQI